MATWSNYWQMGPTGETEYVADPEGGQAVPVMGQQWNQASGFATPEAYLAATYGLPEWAVPFVGRGTEADVRNRGGAVDSAGFFRPGTDGSGNLILGAVDPETGAWSQRDAFLQAAQKALGGGVAMPLADARLAYENSEIPGTLGLTFDQYLARQYVNPRTQQVGGVGDFLVADKANEFDWGLGDRSTFFQTLTGKILPVFGAAWGLNSLLSGVANAAGAGMPGMAEGYGAIEASMGTPIGGASAAAQGVPLNLGSGLNLTNDAIISNIANGLGDVVPGVTSNASAIAGASGGGLGLETLAPAASGLPTVPTPGGAPVPPPTVPGPASGIGKTALDSLTKAGVNLATQGIISALAGGSGAEKTDPSRLNQSGALVDAAIGKLPTEEEAAGRAHADVTQAFDVQRKNYLRTLASYGINPNSGRFGNTALKFGLQEGKTDALSQNLARQGVRNAAVGTAATLAGINQGLTQTQALLDANNYRRQQELLSSIGKAVQPVTDAAGPVLTKAVSNWFDLPSGADSARKGISVNPSVFDQFDADLVKA